MNAPLVPIERVLSRLEPSSRTPSSSKELLDQRKRPLTDLRLSVTDRCNFRCPYCKPKNKPRHQPARGNGEPPLDFDEITNIASAFVDLTVRKVRLTGGEPLVRRGLPQLVERLARLRIDDLCMTTNGSLLASQAAALSDAGLGRVTVSLDALDEVTFHRMTDGQASLGSVLAGIEAARRHGLAPVKINMVVQRGLNEHAILPMADWARREGLELRFIEYMDVGCANGWQRGDVVTAAEILELVGQNWPLEAAPNRNDHDTAERFRYLDGAGHIGVVASISRPFCSDCARARVSSKGMLYPCLFAPSGVDLAGPLREGQDLRPLISGFWRRRTDRYSELRAIMPSGLSRPEMSEIGG